MTNPQQTLFSMVNIERISPKVRNKTRVLTLTSIIQHSFEVLATSIRTEEEIKGL